VVSCGLKSPASRVSWGYDSRHARKEPPIAGFVLQDANNGVHRLACRAFQAVFRRKQTQHRVLLVWLEKELKAVRFSDIEERRLLEAAVTRR